MCADPEVMRYVGDRRVLNREDAWRQLAMLAGHWQLRGYGMWAVEERATGTFLGRVGLHYPEGWPDREIAWALARPHWGNGYAFEAASAALNHAFVTLG
jgi:RimJ/RimL family protein N-acetyltransferase